MFFLTSLSDIYCFARKISRGPLGAWLEARGDSAVHPMAEENIRQLERKANPQRSVGELTFEKVQTLVQCIKAFGALTAV